MWVHIKPEFKKNHITAMTTVTNEACIVQGDEMKIAI